MDEDVKFIQVLDSFGKPIVLNIDQIVGFNKTETGCFLRTTNSDYCVNLKTTFEELITMLPSVMKLEDINQ